MILPVFIFLTSSMEPILYLVQVQVGVAEAEEVEEGWGEGCPMVDRDPTQAQRITPIITLMARVFPLIIRGKALLHPCVHHPKATGWGLMAVAIMGKETSEDRVMAPWGVASCLQEEGGGAFLRGREVCPIICTRLLRHWNL